MDPLHATEDPDTEYKMNKCMPNMFCFPHFCGRVQSSMLEVTKVNSNSITGHFGTFFVGTTYTFACVAHSMIALCLQAIPHCKGDKSTIKMI